MTFKYNYSSSVNKEVLEIREKYMAQEKNKLSELKKLDSRVQNAGVAESLAVGVAGCLVFGVAMCMGLDVIGGGMVLAVILGILGSAIMLPAYYIYRRLQAKAKELYTPKILQLADEITSGNQD